jgi:hypothetical protein
MTKIGGQGGRGWEHDYICNRQGSKLDDQDLKSEMRGQSMSFYHYPSK